MAAPSMARAPSAADSDITVASIDNIIQELLQHAELEVDNSVRSIEEASFGQRGKAEEEVRRIAAEKAARAGGRASEKDPKRPQARDHYPNEDLPLPPVEAENSFTPSFAQESSVWYETKVYDHASDLEDDLGDVAGEESLAEHVSDAVSESESEFSLRSSTQKSPYDGGGYSSKDAIKSVQNRLLSVMKKEAKLHIKAEMAKTEVDVLKSKLSACQEKVKRAERQCKALEVKNKQLRSQDMYAQCRKLQASLAKSTELNSKLVHKIQTLKLELRKEKARRHHAEGTARLSFAGNHAPLDVMDSMESLQTFQADQSLRSASAASHFDGQNKSFEVSDLRNQVRHLKGALEQAEAANSAILSHIQEESPRVQAAPSTSRAALGEDSDYGQSQASPVVNLHNFLSKPVIAEVKSSLAELKSSLTEEYFEHYRGGGPAEGLGRDESTSDFDQEPRGGVRMEGGPKADSSNLKLHYASQVPPQNMDQEDLKHAREAYQEEVKRMKALFLSRLQLPENASPSREPRR
ncbi:hypothetical protein HOP50_05g39340 [Chloropicon primus]|uniref:Uncharacterized protein n=1 Tax=Chloropicon primus TaxID=1764295 RepID=A0A5B8MP84_9CHLO|nr:hypothetical protein A3770_05p39230 [Chloropicon primus]UPR00619.1 hypothetical protein HOP50_05g39340 [Chloropicon primus]|eukprot:QDZ21405.1 hypothetical protein A3770_05p39230 [Chloropicon primus]